MAPPRHAVMWPPLLLLLLRHLPASGGQPEHRSLITIENEKAHELDIDPDEYLWETLPGRCCFMSGADDCDLCSVWSDPQNFCHTSRESCELCGMSLYCPAPPPLLNADKVCKGQSRVGVGCNDDLDTGLCQTSGALAACQSACRHTAHCEMIVLYTDAMAGTCVLCRNMLDFDHTEQASTRVYAVEHLDLHPPAPPGYQHEDIKHFSILQDPSPPPPPHPPPSPPRHPPPPLPAALGTKTDTHIECEFFEGMDYSILKKTTGGGGGVAVDSSAAASIDTRADTKRHCCSQCGMHAGCTDFVYEPASKVCVLMPPVPSYLLRRSPNNSTIAGSVTISRIDQSHAACHFHVGSGYAGGAIGLGNALPGKQMRSKQDCCDACERDERCAKFVFEHYAGDCQMFGPEAEHYYTFNLLSGTVDGRAAPVVDQRGDGQPDEDDGSTPIDNAYDDWAGGVDGGATPPTPPLFSSFGSISAPSPPGVEGDVAQRVLADFSLVMGFLILVGFLICFFLFFGQDIQSLAYSWTGGRVGKPPKSLLPTRDPGESADGPSTRRKKGGELPPGWAKVTVQTTLVNQRKDLEVAGCQTLAELRELIWDEFGHLLKGMRVKDSVLLVWASDEADDTGGRRASEAASAARWMQVTEASEMAKVIVCSAIKLRDKKDVDMKGLAIAFAPALTHKGKGKGKGKGQRLALKHRKNGDDSEEAASDDSEEADGGAIASSRSNGGSGSRFQKRGGFQRLNVATPDDDSDGGSDGDDGPLCDDIEPPSRSSSGGGNNRSKSLRNGGASGGGKADRRKESDGRSANGRSRKAEPEAASPAKKGASKQRAVRSRAVVSDEEVEQELAAQKPTARPLLKKRVEVCGLVGKADLNGRRGLAATFDAAKGRYRVRLDARLGQEEQVLAFKAENLRVAT